MKPIIGITPLIDYLRKSWWMLPNYVEMIRDCGGVPIILPFDIDDEDIFRLCDMCGGVLFTGGQDVNPELYHTQKSPYCGDVSKEKDDLEQMIFRYCLERKKPMFGICRGIQFFNVMLGGTLYQDLPTEHTSEVNHCMNAPYDRIQHYVIYNNKKIGVNSYHHQAIKDLAPDLEATAISEDGFVEGVKYCGSQYLQAIQWHPEYDYKTNEVSRKMMEEFIFSSLPQNFK